MAVSLAEGRLSVSAIDDALPPPVLLPIELMLLPIVVVVLSPIGVVITKVANAAGDAIPTTRETAATIVKIEIKFNLYICTYS
jgi:hypothetical protein